MKDKKANGMNVVLLVDGKPIREVTSLCFDSSDVDRCVKKMLEDVGKIKLNKDT